MKQNCSSRFIIVLLLLCGNVQFGASFLVVHHNHHGGCCHRLYETGLYYKSDPQEPLLTKSSFPHPLSDVTNASSDDDGAEAAAASSSTTNTATTTTTKRRRSFLHQLDRFLTLLQDTSSHLKRHTFLSGNFAPVSEEHIQVPVQIVEGSIPEGFGDGCFCRNGPNPILEMQRKRYHWFDGHAMLHSLMIQNGTATYTNQFIPCPRYTIEQELGEEYFPTIGEYTGLIGLLKLTFHARLVKEKIGDLKQVAPPNTNILMFNNKFYCLHEANLPMECRMYRDGHLEYVGYETFGGILDYPVSAHPVVDCSTDDLIFHSYSVDEQLIEEHGTMKVGKYNSCSQTVDTYLVPTPSKKHVSFAHSLLSTEHFIIVWDSSVHFKTDALFYGGSFFKHDEKHSLKFGVIPKDATSRDEVIWIDSHESGAIVHPLHAWEEVEEVYSREDGTLISSRTIIKLWSPFSKDLELDLNKANTFHMIQYSIDMEAKSVTREVIDDTINSEFSVMPPRTKVKSSMVAAVPLSYASRSLDVSNIDSDTDKDVTKIKYSTLAYEDRFGFTAILGEQGHFVGYAKWDIVKRRLDCSVYYDKNEIGGEPTIVRGADNKLYIGCYVYNEQKAQSYFVLYNAETNEKVCRLQMPYRVPFGFHSQFISGEDLEKHFKYHESKPPMTKEEIEEEIFMRLVQQMKTMLSFP